MGMGLDYPITEICLLVQDVDRSIAFYEKIGFRLQRRGDSFASFNAAGMPLAVWGGSYVAEHVGFPAADPEKPVHKVMTALRVANADIVRSIYEEIGAAGIATLSPPRTYEEWNAYCFYFSDPDGNAWEVYAWEKDGPDGIRNSTWIERPVTPEGSSA